MGLAYVYLYIYISIYRKNLITHLFFFLFQIKFQIHLYNVYKVRDRTGRFAPEARHRAVRGKCFHIACTHLFFSEMERETQECRRLCVRILCTVDVGELRTSWPVLFRFVFIYHLLLFFCSEIHLKSKNWTKEKGKHKIFKAN